MAGKLNGLFRFYKRKIEMVDGGKRRNRWSTFPGCKSDSIDYIATKYLICADFRTIPSCLPKFFGPDPSVSMIIDSIGRKWRIVQTE